MRFLPTIVLTAAVLSSLNSCAYMQTHKNISEMGVTYTGSKLTKDNIQLYSSNGSWYIAAPQVELKRSYPVIHDGILFTENLEPTDTVIEGRAGGYVYLPISRGTATVLQRTDGYADVSSLLAESLSQPGAVLDSRSLRNATRHPILAMVEDKGSSVHISSRNPAQNSWAIRALSSADKYTVDVIGTLAYNIAVPFIAPVKFFWEFCHDD